MVELQELSRERIRFRVLRPRLRFRGGSVSMMVVLDTAFLLLGFFLLASPAVLKPGIQIELPEAVFADGVVQGSVLVSVTRDGRIYFDDEAIELDRLQRALADRVMQNPSLVLVIEADRRVSHGQLVDIWGVVQAAGVRSVLLATGLQARDG